MSNDLVIKNDTSVINQNDSGTLQIQELVNQVALIQQAMKSVMKEKEHYDVIPGCGKKQTLLKPGAEKLGLLFRLSPTYEITRTDYQNGHREFQVVCTMTNIPTGRIFGSGVGSACTLETKWRFKGGSKEFTGVEAPREYWNLKKEGKFDEALKLIGGSGFSVDKNSNTGKWEITKKGEKIEHDNPADFYNTVLKMAKKRAQVDAILTCTGASDIFTQDIEELVENGVLERKEEKPSVQTPQRKSQQPPQDYVVDASYEVIPPPDDDEYNQQPMEYTPESSPEPTEPKDYREVIANIINKKLEADGKYNGLSEDGKSDLFSLTLKQVTEGDYVKDGVKTHFDGYNSIDKITDKSLKVTYGKVKRWAGIK